MTSEKQETAVCHEDVMGSGSAESLPQSYMVASGHECVKAGVIEVGTPMPGSNQGRGGTKKEAGSICLMYLTN
jgi:hypothetical protein